MRTFFRDGDCAFLDLQLKADCHCDLQASNGRRLPPCHRLKPDMMIASAERGGARISDPFTIFISAGEASGEHYGALLLLELKKRLKALNREAVFFGMGGTRMHDAGLERVVRSEDMAVMGITEVVRHLPRIYREFRRLKASIRARHPDVAILIDFPDIHFKLAQEFHRLGVPVIFFVSPQLWAWKKHRIKLVQKYVDKMLVIFPLKSSFIAIAASKPSSSDTPSPIFRSHPSRVTSSHKRMISILQPPGSASSPAAAPRKFATTSLKFSPPRKLSPTSLPPRSSSSSPSRQPSMRRSERWSRA